MKVLELVTQLRLKANDIGKVNPEVEIYDASSGMPYEIVAVYIEDGSLCIDVSKKG